MTLKKDNLRILIVEDDYLLAKGMAKLIQRLSGYQVLVTDKLNEIIQLCEGGEVDLVIMDVNLPEAHGEEKNVSGADISRLLKTNSQTAEIPIILITAYALESERQSLLDISQADEFYLKPITDYDDLIQTINRLCGC
ncbi:response regulator [Lyngbya sp. PCC 8106]|uniref:response regulator n=1 Tax=Lyngbya sp. (strain PCC 8106) TaxID=313612 RepID=UPI0000EAD656|nr:response regulator [Lyngbya sp. PCC 8106]EAW33766.1 Response regulator receiver domain protein (CheY) [Lyngbya sp. PCC 8106]